MGFIPFEIYREWFIYEWRHNPIKQLIVTNDGVIPIHEKNILTEYSKYTKEIEKLKNKYRLEKMVESSYDEKLLKIEQVIKDIEDKIKNEISKL